MVPTPSTGNAHTYLSSKELSTKEGPFPGHCQVDADALRRGAAVQCRPLRGQLVCQEPGLDGWRDRAPCFCRSSEVSPQWLPARPCSLPQLFSGNPMSVAPWVEPVQDLLEVMLSLGRECTPRPRQDGPLQVPVLYLQ